MRHIQQHMNVLNALIIRDLMSRFGRNHLGFVWTILEPMILCTGVLFIWSFIHDPFIHGIPVIELVFTGYMPLTLWRHLTNPLALILRRNGPMFYHIAISPAHIMLARTLLEFLSTSAGAAIIYFILYNFGLISGMEHAGLVIAGWIFTGWYFGAMGLFIGAMTESWEIAEKFVQPFNYLLLPISGTFFLVDWMPDWAQRLLAYNPSVNCFEMIRAGMAGEALTTHYDPFYLTACCVVMSVIALFSLLVVRSRIELN